MAMRYQRCKMLFLLMGRFMSKAQKTTLTLSLLQQQAHMTSHVKRVFL